MVGRGAQAVAVLREHALGCVIAAAILYWLFDGLLHAASGHEGYLQHLLSGEAHHLAPRLVTAALMAGLGFVVRNQYLRSRAEEQLRSSERRFRTLAAAAPAGVVESDALGNLVYVNDRASSLLGLPIPECLGRGYERSLHEDDRARVLRRIAESIGRGDPFREEFRFARRDGSVAWVMCEGAALRNGTGTVTGWIGTITDITSRVSTEAELAERTRLAELSAAVGSVLAEEAQLREMLSRCARTVVTHLDALFARIWLYDPAAEMLVLRASEGRYTRLDGDHARIPLGSMKKIGRIGSERTPQLTNQVVGDPLVDDQEWARREGITAFAGNPLLVGDGLVGVMGVFSRHRLSPAVGDWLATIGGEIALGIQRRLLEEQLESAAYTDELTGLFNRRGFFALAGKQLEIALRGRDSVGLVYIDLDRMKEINDRWGHEAGDRALRDVAEILNRTFRTSDILGRIGGDEFVAFLPDSANGDTRRVVLANLRQKLADHNARAERPFTLSLSAGVAVSTAGVACSIEELVTRADRDMYREKRLGRGLARPSAGPARPRSAPRLAARIPIEGVAAELCPGGAARIVDVGLGGMCVGTALPLRVGESLGVRIPVDGDDPLALSGTVVWADEIALDSSDPRRYRSGVRFVQIDGKLQGTLVQLIAGHC